MPITRDTLRDNGFVLNRKDTNDPTRIFETPQSTNVQIPLSSIPLAIPNGALDLSKLNLGRLNPNENVGTSNFVTGVSGWRIYGAGNVEFNDGVFRGALTAATIDIGGSDASSFHVDINGNMWLGAATFATATFSVSNAGSMIATDGQIATWYINATTLSSGAVEATSNVLIDSANSLIRLGPTSGSYVTIDGANQRIRSSNYVTGVSGFNVDPALVEAQNIIARGILKGATFQYDVISAVGGQLLVSNADTLNADMSALDASTLTTKGTTTWAVNDMLYVRAITASGIQEEYLRVTNIGSAPVYTVTRDLAAAYGANSNPAWGKGTTIVKIGTSDGAAAYSGGWLRLLGEGTNSPYYSVFSRTGVGYNAYSERVRLGNLNGIGPFATNTYGIFIGNYSTGKYLSYDDGTGNLNVNGYIASSKGAFGGDGSDGALSISSGTTTIDLGGAAYYTLNYTSVSITGTGVLTFSNPHANGTIIFIKSQGNVTITSTATAAIDASGMGAAGGASTTDGNQGYGTITISSKGLQGGDAPGGSADSVGALATAANLFLLNLAGRFIRVTPGGGGGGGGTGQNGGGPDLAGGAGGNGGAGLIIECAGAYNFGASSTIKNSGNNGVDGTAGNGDSGASGAGAGGAGGITIVMYNTLTANSGTYTNAGGNGGAGKAGNYGGTVRGSGAGGSGGANRYAGGAGGAGRYANNGIAGSNGSGTGAGTGGAGGTQVGGDGGSGGGGGGSAGDSLAVVNNEFA